MKIKIFFLLMLSCLFSFAQGDVKQGLYVSHVESSGKGAFRQKIFVYHFLNGSYVGRDEVVSVDGKKEGKDYIRTDRGINLIYKDQYLITGLGNIIDLKLKKVLFDGKATLVRCSNDSAIFYTNDIFKGKFYSVYEFKKGTYGEIKDLLFNPKFGRDVEFDKSTTPFKINYYPQGKSKVVLVSNAGYGQQHLKDGNSMPDPPLYWLDNDNFIYVQFNQINSEFSIMKVNVDSKKETFLFKQTIQKENSAARLLKKSADQFILIIGNKQYLLDLKTLSSVALEASFPENGFSYEFKTDQKGRIIKLNEKEVGKFHFETKNFTSGQNIAAFVKEMRIGTETYQQGLMVWNANKQKWEPVDADEVLSLIGWANE